MELRSLRYFLAVIDEGGFRGAARKMLVTQPPLSREIQRLERELGATLFDRASRPVALTRFGRAYATEVREVLAHLERSVEVARRACDPQERLRVGFNSAVANDLLPRAVRAFRSAHPDVVLVLEEQPSGAVQLAQLREDQLDVALVRESVHEAGLTTIRIMDEPILAVLPLDHPLATTTDAIPLADLDGQPFVFWSRASSPAAYDGGLRSLRRMGVHLPIVQEVIGVQAVLGLVAAGLGISLLPASVAALRYDGVVCRPLGPPSPTMPLCAVHHSDDASESLAGFLEALRTATQASTPRPDQEPRPRR
jgi:DNA-binding transcriptional LysR family regulator